MPAATANGSPVQQQIPGTEAEQSTTTDKSSKRSGNVFFKGLSKEMWDTPYELDFNDNMMSDDFCLDKGYKTLTKPIGFKTKKEWMDYCTKVWDWGEQEEEREVAAIANDVLNDYKDNPKVLEMILEKTKKLLA